MWILIAALPIGMLLGLIAGGSAASLPDVRLRNWYLLIPAFTIVSYMSLDRDPPAEWLLLPTGLVLFAVVAFRNIATVGMTIVGIGVLANLTPVLLNGEMPVREKAIIQAGLADSSNIDLVRLGAGRRFEESGDIIVGLGAIIPVKAVREVLTFGDLIVIAGLVNVGFRAVKPPSRRRQDEHREPAANLAEALGVGDPTVFAPPQPTGGAGGLPTGAPQPVQTPVPTHATTPEPLWPPTPAQTPEPAHAEALEATSQLSPDFVVDLRDSEVSDDAGGQDAPVEPRRSTAGRPPVDIFADDLPSVVQGSATWGD